MIKELKAQINGIKEMLTELPEDYCDPVTVLLINNYVKKKEEEVAKKEGELIRGLYS